MIEEPDGRVIVRENNRVIIRRDEAERFRRLDRDARVERRANGERVIITRRPDGAEIVTVVDADGRLLRRARRVGGREVILLENRPFGPQRRPSVFVDIAPPRVNIPREKYIVEIDDAAEGDVYEALSAPPIDRIERRYTLDEVRYSPQLRDRVRRVDLNTVTFDSGSWEVAPDQFGRLERIAAVMKRVIDGNPNTVFLIEGHTDAVGNDDDNLSLSDRRAESIALILTEEFRVPPENLTTQGYGEQQLKVPTQEAERQNRRVTVRNITALVSASGPAGGGAPAPRRR